MPRKFYMPPEHERVLQILRHCRGRHQAITNAQLAELSGVPERRCRHIVKELIELFGEPIGTAYGHPGGHYLIASQEERRETVEALAGHAKSILRRMGRLDRQAARRLLGQLELEL